MPTPTPFNLAAELVKLKKNEPRYPYVAYHATRNRGTEREYEEIYVKNLDASDGTMHHITRLELDNKWPIVAVGNLIGNRGGDGVTTSSIADEHKELQKHFDNAEAIRTQTRSEMTDDVQALESKLAKAKALEAAKREAAKKEEAAKKDEQKGAPDKEGK